MTCLGAKVKRTKLWLRADGSLDEVPSFPCSDAFLFINLTLMMYYRVERISQSTSMVMISLVVWLFCFLQLGEKIRASQRQCDVILSGVSLFDLNEDERTEIIGSIMNRRYISTIGVGAPAG